MELYKEIITLLFYDRRDNGVRGRAIKFDLPSQQFLCGDRLEPNELLPDVALFEKLDFPCWVLFWRRNQETSLRHRNPLWCESLGIGLHCLTEDTLHCLYLGIVGKI